MYRIPTARETPRIFREIPLYLRDVEQYDDTGIVGLHRSHHDGVLFLK